MEMDPPCLETDPSQWGSPGNISEFVCWESLETVFIRIHNLMIKSYSFSMEDGISF